MMSGDLEQLLTQTSLLGPDGAAGLLAGAARAPSFNIAKLESLNLPDEMMRAAIAEMERGVGSAARQPSAAPAAGGPGVGGGAAGGGSPHGGAGAADAGSGGGDAAGGSSLTPQKRKIAA
jgi:hypothetical protein